MQAKLLTMIIATTMWCFIVAIRASSEELEGGELSVELSVCCWLCDVPADDEEGGLLGDEFELSTV